MYNQYTYIYVYLYFYIYRTKRLWLKTRNIRNPTKRTRNLNSNISSGESFEFKIYILDGAVGGEPSSKPGPGHGYPALARRGLGMFEPVVLILCCSPRFNGI